MTEGLKNITHKHSRELKCILSSQLMLRGINNLRLVQMINPFPFVRLNFRLSQVT